MLHRVECFFDRLDVLPTERRFAERLAEKTAEIARGMTDKHDYLALAAVCLHRRPRQIFEIGTYLGVTSNFFLELLPRSQVVSIAYVQPRVKLLGLRFNNTELAPDEVGRMVAPENRRRFQQLMGNSHELKANETVARFGRFDLVFIDGDHSREGVAQDTDLARGLLSERGAICWHDANPKPKYMDVRRYLEQDLPHEALATRDDYHGGIAYWAADEEAQFKTQTKRRAA